MPTNDTTSSHNQAYGFIVGSAIAKGRIASSISPRPRRTPGVLAIVTRWMCQARPRSNELCAICSAERRFSTIIRQSRSLWPRHSSRLALQRPDSCRLYREARGVRSRRPRPGEGKPAKLRGCGRSSRRRLRARVRCRAGQSWMKLTRRRTKPCHDGAACHDRVLGRRPSHALDASQMINWGKGDIAKTLGIPKTTCVSTRPISAADLAEIVRESGRSASRARCAPAGPVKVALTRPLIFNNTTHRPATIQRIRIGAGPTARSLRSLTRARPVTCPRALPRGPWRRRGCCMPARTA